MKDLGRELQPLAAFENRSCKQYKTPVLVRIQGVQRGPIEHGRTFDKVHRYITARIRRAEQRELIAAWADIDLYLSHVRHRLEGLMFAADGGVERHKGPNIVSQLA